ncbi:unnamed protein product, partial [Rotaria magnacalcarata]
HQQAPLQFNPNMNTFNAFPIPPPTSIQQTSSFIDDHDNSGHGHSHDHGDGHGHSHDHSDDHGHSHNH